ncbi:hypothetical protein [Variovorax rhizosphaerae]|uniref:Secreted protein n=1 Tax=Variovorax rhizosphaerae TaxID=1836200 RepID=A0ABU8WXR6_9BURK
MFQRFWPNMGQSVVMIAEVELLFVVADVVTAETAVGAASAEEAAMLAGAPTAVDALALASTAPAGTGTNTSAR